MILLKAIAFVDYENIWTGLSERGCELTPEQLLFSLNNYASTNNMDLLAVYLYANFDREEFWRSQTSFERINIFTRHVYGKNNFANTSLRRNACDLELMLEAQEILLTRPATVEMFLLFTGDGDFLPLARKIRAWGKDVKIIGVEGCVHHSLQPFCETFNVFRDLLESSVEETYLVEQDVEPALRVLTQIQLRLPYVASTKARTALSEQLGRSMPSVKELIRHLLREGILFEHEYPDPNLKIGKTKIYLIRLDNPTAQKALGSRIEEVRERYSKLGILD